MRLRCAGEKCRATFDADPAGATELLAHLTGVEGYSDYSTPPLAEVYQRILDTPEPDPTMCGFTHRKPTTIRWKIGTPERWRGACDAHLAQLVRQALEHDVTPIPYPTGDTP